MVLLLTGGAFVVVGVSLFVWNMHKSMDEPGLAAAYSSNSRAPATAVPRLRVGAMFLVAAAVGLILLFIYKWYTGIAGVFVAAAWFYAFNAIWMNVSGRFLPSSTRPHDDQRRPRAARSNAKGLAPLTGPGPASSLRKYPLLYLYFDDFDQLAKAFRDGNVSVAIHDKHLSEGLTSAAVMANESLLLRLYSMNEVRMRMGDGFTAFREVEADYEDWLAHPDKLSVDPMSCPDPEARASLQSNYDEIALTVRAIQSRLATG